jgi:hypothetical protein
VIKHLKEGKKKKRDSPLENRSAGSAFKVRLISKILQECTVQCSCENPKPFKFQPRTVTRENVSISSQRNSQFIYLPSVSHINFNLVVGTPKFNFIFLLCWASLIGPSLKKKIDLWTRYLPIEVSSFWPAFTTGHKSKT